MRYADFYLSNTNQAHPICKFYIFQSGLVLVKCRTRRWFFEDDFKNYESNPEPATEPATGFEEGNNAGDGVASDSHFPLTGIPWGNDPVSMYAKNKPTVPAFPGAEDTRIPGRISYDDRGAARESGRHSIRDSYKSHRTHPNNITTTIVVHLYPPGSEINALIPSWDWERGRIGKSSLRLPRMLAYAVNRRIASQAFDGNLGLALPMYASSY